MSQTSPNTSEPESAPKRRRWFSFRLTTLFLLVTIVAIVAAYPHMRVQVQLWRLQSYVGRDLRAAPYSEQQLLGQIIKSLQPFDQAIFFDKSFHPQTCWRLWRMKAAGETHFVLLQHRTTDPRLQQMLNSGVVTDASSQSEAIVLLYDSQGKHIDNWRFPTGWQLDAMDAELVEAADSGEPLLCIYLVDGEPDHMAKQYYALRDDGCILVRLEDGAGDLYVHPQDRASIVDNDEAAK